MTTGIDMAHGAAGQPAAPAAPHTAEFGHAADAAKHSGPPAEQQGPARPSAADVALKAKLDKDTTWIADAHKAQGSIADTIAHPGGGHFLNKDADMGDARISLNRMGIHLTKLENLHGQAQSPEFQHLPAAEQQKVLSSIDAEKANVQSFTSEANGRANGANRDVASNDEHRAQIGMTTTKVVMTAAPVVIGAIVEKETGSKVAGVAARDAAMITERYVASGSNAALGGSESTLDPELGTKRAVWVAAAADLGTAGALKKWAPTEGLAVHGANIGGGVVKGGLTNAADENPLQHPGAFATKFALGGAAGVLTEGGKIPGGLKNVKGTGLEHVLNHTLGIGAGTVGAVIQSKDAIGGGVTGGTKVSSKVAGEFLHTVVTKGK